MKKLTIDYIEINEDNSQYVLVVRGWADPEFLTSHPAEVRIGNQLIGTLTINANRPDVHQRYPAVPIKSGFIFEATLQSPFRFDDFVSIIEKDTQKTIRRRKVEKLLTVHHQITIDQITHEDEKFVIDGWAVSALNKKVKIETRNQQDYEIEQVARYERKDVTDFLDDESAYEKSGIRLTVCVKNRNAKMLMPVFLTDGVLVEQSEIRLKANRPSGWRRFHARFPLLSALMNAQNISKGLLVLKTNGVGGLLAQMKKFTKRHKAALSYEAWIKNQTRTPEVLQNERDTSFEHNPLISLVVPVYNTKHEYLHDLINSVREQTYSNWELLLVNGGSTDQEIDRIIQSVSSQDNRVRLLSLGKNLGISGNTNAGFEQATGEFIGLADHDDMLDPSALFEMVKCINLQNPDLIYSDEDKFSKSLSDRFQPHFKPDFNLELLHSYNYICHLTLIRTSLIRRIGGERSIYDGAQDYDLFLRVAELPVKIAHIPMILYHWRSHERSTARSIDAKSYTYEATMRALADHLVRIGRAGKVEKGLIGGTYHTRYKIKAHERVSIIIPNKDQTEVLKRCITSILRKSTYPDYEILVIENNSRSTEIFDYYKEISQNPNIRVLTYQQEFNYSAINNWGIQHASGQYYLLLNNDIEVITADWIERMVEYAQFPEYAVVGAKLYYPNKTIQHGGVILGIGGVAGHSHKYYPRSAPGYMGRLQVVQNLSAVTAACMLIRSDAFKQVGGLDEQYAVAFNDIDFCMKITQAGYRIVWTPYAELYHHESLSRGTENTPEKIMRFNREVDRFKEKWGYYINDPHYNVNLSMEREDFSLKQKESRA